MASMERGRSSGNGVAAGPKASQEKADAFAWVFQSLGQPKPNEAQAQHAEPASSFDAMMSALSQSAAEQDPLESLPVERLAPEQRASLKQMLMSLPPQERAKAIALIKERLNSMQQQQPQQQQQQAPAQPQQRPVASQAARLAAANASSASSIEAAFAEAEVPAEPPLLFSAAQPFSLPAVSTTASSAPLATSAAAVLPGVSLQTLESLIVNSVETAMKTHVDVAMAKMTSLLSDLTVRVMSAENKLDHLATRVKTAMETSDEAQDGVAQRLTELVAKTDRIQGDLDALRAFASDGDMISTGTQQTLIDVPLSRDAIFDLGSQPPANSLPQSHAMSPPQPQPQPQPRPYVSSAIPPAPFEQSSMAYQHAPNAPPPSSSFLPPGRAATAFYPSPSHHQQEQLEQLARLQQQQQQQAAQLAAAQAAAAAAQAAARRSTPAPAPATSNAAASSSSSTAAASSSSDGEVQFDSRLIADAVEMGFSRSVVIAQLHLLYDAKKPCNDINVLIDALSSSDSDANASSSSSAAAGAAKKPNIFKRMFSRS